VVPELEAESKGGQAGDQKQRRKDRFVHVRLAIQKLRGTGVAQDSARLWLVPVRPGRREPVKVLPPLLSRTGGIAELADYFGRWRKNVFYSLGEARLLG